MVLATAHPTAGPAPTALSARPRRAGAAATSARPSPCRLGAGRRVQHGLLSATASPALSGLGTGVLALGPRPPLQAPPRGHGVGPCRGFATGPVVAAAGSGGVVLLPIGDGSTDHLDRKRGVRMPPPIQLPDGESVVVGRKDTDVVINIDTVSTTHCKLECSNGKLFVTDLSSSNGTWINGRRIGAKLRKRVKTGDELVLGDEFLCKFEVAEVEEEEEEDVGGGPDLEEIARAASGAAGGAVAGLRGAAALASKVGGALSSRDETPVPPPPKKSGVPAWLGGQKRKENAPASLGGQEGYVEAVEEETYAVTAGEGDAAVEAIVLEPGSSMGAATDTSTVSDIAMGGGMVGGAAAFAGAEEEEEGAPAALFTLVPVGRVGEEPSYPALYIESDTALIGREPSMADVAIPCPAVDGIHCRAEAQGGSLYITDLDSSTGTEIDGSLLEAGRRYMVEPGQDVVLAGEAWYRVARGAAAPGTVAIGRARGRGGAPPPSTKGGAVLLGAGGGSEGSSQGAGGGGALARGSRGALSVSGNAVQDDEEEKVEVEAMTRASAEITSLDPTDGSRTTALAQGEQAEEGGVFGLLKGFGAAINNSQVQVNYQYKPVIQLGGKAAGTGELKAALLVEVVGKERGLRGTSDQKQKIEELARALEAKNPTPSPLKSPLMNGRWALQYTTNKTVLGAGRPFFLRPTGPIYQTVDIFNLKSLNEEEFSVMGFKWNNRASANLSAQSNSRVGVEAENFKVGPFQVNAPPKTPARRALEWEQQAMGAGAEGGMAWLDTTFLDTDLRISRSASGDVYILTRDDPNDP